MNAVALPVRQGTDEWLEARLDGIGSSDAAVIAGERGSVFALWALKTRQAEPEPFDEQTRQMFDMGHRLEPVIADVYTERTGRPLRRVNQMLQHRDVEWAYASLDRVSAVKNERRIVELKTNPWTRWGIGEPVPGDVQAQVQHQLFVTGYDVADVAVLIRGYELHIHEIPRDDVFIDNLVWLETEFMGWVKSGTRPPVDGSSDTQKALQRMFPREYGEILPGTADLYALAEQLRAATRAKVEATNTERSIKNAIRASLGTAAGVAGEGWKLTWTKNRDSIETNWKLVADNLRRLLIQIGETKPASVIQALQSEGLITSGVTLEQLLDAIAELHSQTKEGSRVLRPWFANQAKEAESEETE